MNTRILSAELPTRGGQHVNVAGWVHRVRDLGGVRFLLLRDRSGICQVVLPKDRDDASVGCECVVEVEGKVVPEARAPGGFELLAEHVEAISTAEPPPVEVFKPLAASGHRLETLLEHRAVSLRIPEVLEVFRVQSEIVRAFGEHFRANGFTEIKTPKLVQAGAEGGSAIFEVNYFGRTAYLAQSPQFYKQLMVGSGLERVFEIAPAYRAEKSETSRHTTEFVSLDFEMGFIESVQDVMDTHVGLIRAVFEAVGESCGEILARRKIELPEVAEIPRIAFPEAKRVLQKNFGKTEGLAGDLDTEGERLIGQWARKELGSDLIFVTGYALGKRPAYTMPDAADASASASFDLLYKGLEITTGSQRIHDHHQLAESFRRRGIGLDDLEWYLAAFRHGMPPHGGAGTGLERLTKQILHLRNIKEACLFPRTRYHLSP